MAVEVPLALPVAAEAVDDAAVPVAVDEAEASVPVAVEEDDEVAVPEALEEEDDDDDEVEPSVMLNWFCTLPSHRRQPTRFPRPPSAKQKHPSPE